MNEEKSHTPFLILTVFIAAGLMALLGVSVEPILSPFVLVAALIYVLFPFRSNSVVRRVIVVAVVLFGLWFLHSLIGVLIPFILAFVLAYIFNPLVAKVERARVPRWVAALTVTLGGLGIIAAVVLFVLPIALVQFQGLLGAVGGLAATVVDLLKSGKLFDVLTELGVPVEQAQKILSEELSGKIEKVLIGLFEGVIGFLTGFSSLILHIINAIIIPFLFFYLLKDFPSIEDAFVGLVPHDGRANVLFVLTSVDDILGRYLRGALVVALIQGIIAAVVLSLIGVNYALVLGLMTALLNFIPYVGLITSLVIASIVALFSGGAIGMKVLGVVVLYLSQKLLEATVLGPKIIGSKVGLHPVVLILSLVVFGSFLGFAGMLIAVPTTALLIALVKDWQQMRRRPVPEAPIEV